MFKFMKKILPFVLLLNIVVTFLVVVPFAKGASAGAAPSIIPQQAMKQAAEKMAVAVLRKEGYKIAESTAARATVKSMYSRLSPDGKQFFDAAVQASVMANKSPSWVKAVLPMALIGEIGTIMTGLHSDSANGIPIDYNDSTGVDVALSDVGSTAVTLYNGTGVITVGAFTVISGTSLDTLKNKTTGQTSQVNKGTKITKLTVRKTAADAYEWIVTYTNSYGPGAWVSSTNGANASTMLAALGTTVVSQLIPGIEQEEGAVTSPEGATSDVTIAYPNNDADSQTFEDFNTDIYSDPSKLNDSPDPDAEPVVDSPTLPTTDWWKWLLAPLEKILELLQSLWEWLKQCWSTLTGWWSSLLSKLADLLGAWSLWFTQLFEKLGGWFQSIYDWFSQLLASLGEWFSTLWDWLSDILTSLGEWFNTLWDWLSDIASLIEAIPDTIIDALNDLFVPEQADVTGLYEPIKTTVGEKFNSPDDFQYLQIALGENGCPPDIYANVLGRGSVKVADLKIVCDNANWWKPIMTGFMWFLFGWWLFRKANALMARNGGVR